MKLPYKPDFSNKTAVVTGGAGVLCAMFAKALAQCGARVAILDLARERAQQVADEIRAAGGEAMAVQVNVLEPASVEAAHQQVLAAYGPCAMLINGAGGNSPRATTDDEFFDRAALENAEKKSFFDLDPTGFYFVISLNLKGTLLQTQALARDMIDAPGGVILNIS